MVDWTQILREHGQAVWNTVYRLTRNNSDAADCFQETFIAAWRRVEIEPIQSWRALLTHIATRVAFACLRRRKREQRYTGSLESGLVVDPKAQRPGELLLEAERAEAFRLWTVQACWNKGGGIREECVGGSAGWESFKVPCDIWLDAIRVSVASFSRIRSSRKSKNR